MVRGESAASEAGQTALHAAGRCAGLANIGFLHSLKPKNISAYRGQ